MLTYLTADPDMNVIDRKEDDDAVPTLPLSFQRSCIKFDTLCRHSVGSLKSGSGTRSLGIRDDRPEEAEE